LPGIVIKGKMLLNLMS